MTASRSAERLQASFDQPEARASETIARLTSSPLPPVPRTQIGLLQHPASTKKRTNFEAGEILVQVDFLYA
jgi:hypothetical protein